MYAIIATGGKQYKVSEGDIIDIEKIEGESGTEVTFDKVICIGGDAMKVGEIRNCHRNCYGSGQGQEGCSLSLQEKDRLSQEERSQTALHPR